MAGMSLDDFNNIAMQMVADVLGPDADVCINDKNGAVTASAKANKPAVERTEQYLTKKDAYEILNTKEQDQCPFMRFRQTVPFVKSNFYQQHCDLKGTDYRSNLYCKKRDQNCLQMLLNECKQIVKS